MSDNNNNNDDWAQKAWERISDEKTRVLALDLKAIERWQDEAKRVADEIADLAEFVRESYQQVEKVRPQGVSAIPTPVFKVVRQTPPNPEARKATFKPAEGTIAVGCSAQKTSLVLSLRATSDGVEALQGEALVNPRDTIRKWIAGQLFQIVAARSQAELEQAPDAVSPNP